MKGLTTVMIGAALALAAAGCQRQPEALGGSAPAGAEQATVQSLAQEAARYAGKMVVVEGLVAGGCSDGDGVVLADKTWRIEVKTSPAAGFQIPVRAGARLRAWGIVGLEREEEGGEGEKHAEAGEHEGEEHEEPGVVVEARRVEWLS